MKTQKMGRKQRGFTITEMMLVLGVGSIIIGGAFYGYKQLSATNTSQQNLTGQTHLVIAVKNKWQGIGSYAAVSPTAVNAAKLVEKPISWDGSAIKNAYDKPIGFAGTATNFVSQIEVPPENCLDTVGALDGIAYRIDVDTAVVAANAAEDPTKTVKASGSTINATKANTQCSLATTVVTAFVK